MRTLVVVPTYQEAENIAEMLRRVRAAVPDLDVLVVDDNSPDGTADLARAVGQELGQIDVTVRPAKNGLGTAYRHGFAIAFDRGYDVLIQMDADLSHDPAAIPGLLGALTEGVGMVIGSRYVPGGSIPHWPAHRRAASKYGNLYTRAVLGLKITDTTSGFRAWRAQTLKNIGVLETTAGGYLFQIELAYRVVQQGARLAEVPITFTDRVRGHSKMNASVVIEELTHVTWWGLRDRVFRRRRRPAVAA
jgi:dolichol-phosphate mannosyltransferase